MELDRILKALGEPMRLKIYQALLERSTASGLFPSSDLGIGHFPASEDHEGSRFGLWRKYGYHMHYLPDQGAIDFLAEQVEQMRRASLQVDREQKACQCEYRGRKV